MGTSYRPSASDQKPNCCRVAAKKNSRAFGWSAGGKRSDAKSKGERSSSAARSVATRSKPAAVDGHPRVRRGLGGRSRLEECLRADRADRQGGVGDRAPGGFHRMVAQGESGQGRAAEGVAGPGGIELARPHARHVGGVVSLEDAGAPRAASHEQELPGTRRRGVQGSKQRARFGLVAEEGVAQGERLLGEGEVPLGERGIGPARHPVAAGLEVAQERELQRGIGKGHAVDPGLCVFGHGCVLGSQVRLGAPEEAQHLAASFSVVDDLEAGQLVGGDHGSDPLEERLRRRELRGHRLRSRRVHRHRRSRACGREGGVEPRPSRRSRGLAGEVEDVERRPPDDEQARSH